MRLGGVVSHLRSTPQTILRCIVCVCSLCVYIGIRSNADEAEGRLHSRTPGRDGNPHLITLTVSYL
ncbi:hypothetical protein LZ31DRAFT_123322 [Colletotrichum somersetense]|nr:hypothetical protein LZ31DRAFT_123322 [Colletotrichum somersetense]